MLCKYCAKLNTGSSCLFCGNKLRTLTPAEREAERVRIAAREEAAVADAPAQAAPAAARPKEQNGFALAGVILAAFGMTFFLGLIFSIVGLVQSNKMNGAGRKLAISGIVVSVVYLLYTAVFLYMFVFRRMI